eukprot:s3807_g1.t1
MKDKFLPSWEGCICPFCNKGVLVPLSTRSQRETKEYRCNKKNCQKLFIRFICTPSSLWFVVPNGTVSKHKLPHFFFDWLEMNHNLNLVRSGHVTKVEKSIMFGGAPKAWKDVEVEKSIMFGGAPKAWKDVEVDEACFDKRTLKPWEQSEEDAKQGKNTIWEQWGGMVQRGNPKSSMLFKLRPATTVPRAPGPQIRSAQYEYWHRNEDLWVCTGQLLEECMRTIVTNPGAEQSNARALHSIILSTAETTTVQLASRPQPLYC